MNRTPVLLALTAALAVAPATALAGGGHHGVPDTPKPDRPSYDGHKDKHKGDKHKGDKHKGDKHKGDKDGKGPEGRKGPKGTAYLAQACVVEDAVAEGVDVKILSVNAHMRRALAGADTFTAKIDSSTVVRLVGKGRHGSAEYGRARFGRFGDFSSLVAGDRVTVKIWDARGTAAADLKAAYKIIDHGPSKRCGAPPPDCEKPVPVPEDPDPQPDPDPEL